jgi:hypothetical protein
MSTTSPLSEVSTQELPRTSVSDVYPNGNRISSSGQPPPSSSHRRSITVSKGNTVSVVLIMSALETIANSREAKCSVHKSEALIDLVLDATRQVLRFNASTPNY